MLSAIKGGICTGVMENIKVHVIKYVVSCNFSLYIFFYVKAGSLPKQRLTIEW